MTLTYLKTLRLGSAALAVGFVLLTVVSSVSRGALIEYAWQGSIVPIDPAEDPWGIGEPGLRYTISGFVDQGADDIDAEVGGAFFKLTDAELLIDGAAPSFYSGGSIWFRELATSDQILFSLKDVEFRGVQQEFFTGLDLPTSTFTFKGSLEAPPLFLPSMTNSPGGSESESSSYVTFTDVGISVTAKLIPEPSTIVLALFALLGVGVTRWRNRSR